MLWVAVPGLSTCQVKHPRYYNYINHTLQEPCKHTTTAQANAPMGTASMQPPGFQGQSMGPPGHQSPAMMGLDPAAMPGVPGSVRPMGAPPPGGGSPAMSPAMQVSWLFC